MVDEATKPKPGAAADKWTWEAALLQRSIAEGMKPTTQHIALLMSTYADGDGASIRPTVKRLTKESGRGRSTVLAAIAYLRDHGWLEQLHKGSGAARQASVYRLTVPPRVRGEVLHQTK